MTEDIVLVQWRDPTDPPSTPEWTRTRAIEVPRDRANATAKGLRERGMTHVHVSETETHP